MFKLSCPNHWRSFCDIFFLFLVSVQGVGVVGDRRTNQFWLCHFILFKEIGSITCSKYCRHFFWKSSHANVQHNVENYKIMTWELCLCLHVKLIKISDISSKLTGFLSAQSASLLTAVLLDTELNVRLKSTANLFSSPRMKLSERCIHKFSLKLIPFDLVILCAVSFFYNEFCCTKMLRMCPKFLIYWRLLNLTILFLLSFLHILTRIISIFSFSS